MADKPGVGKKVSGGSRRGYSKFPHKALPYLAERNEQRRQFKRLKAEVAEQLRAAKAATKAKYLARLSPEELASWKAKKAEQGKASLARRKAAAAAGDPYAMAAEQRARAKANARNRAGRARRKAAAAAQGPLALAEYLAKERAATRARQARRTAVTGLTRWQRLTPEQRKAHIAYAGAWRRRKREAARAAERAKLLADPITYLLDEMKRGSKRGSRRSPLARALKL